MNESDDITDTRKKIITLPDELRDEISGVLSKLTAPEMKKKICTGIENNLYFVNEKLCYFLVNSEMELKYIIKIDITKNDNNDNNNK